MASEKGPVATEAQPFSAREQLRSMHGSVPDPSMPSGPVAVVNAEASHVRLAVQTYIRLLAALNTCDCNLMARELICARPVRP